MLDACAFIVSLIIEPAKVVLFFDGAGGVLTVGAQPVRMPPLAAAGGAHHGEERSRCEEILETLLCLRADRDLRRPLVAHTAERISVLACRSCLPRAPEHGVFGCSGVQHNPTIVQRRPSDTVRSVRFTRQGALQVSKPCRAFESVNGARLRLVTAASSRKHGPFARVTFTNVVAK